MKKTTVITVIFLVLSGMIGEIYAAAPVITQVTPNIGSSVGHTSVSITGSNFEVGTSVTFGGVEASDIMVSATKLTCKTPAHEPGTVDITVTNSDGLSAMCMQCFTFSEPPRIEQIIPTYGYASDSRTVSIMGSEFSNPLTVTFDGEPAEVIDVKPDSITCMCPPYKNPLITEDITIDVTVTNSDGQSATRRGAYTYVPVPPPILALLTPSEGPVTGGRAVTIKGANFVTGANDTTEVTFGGKAADNITVISDTEISCRTPEYYNVEVPVDVMVTNPDGQKNTCEGCYTYQSVTIEVDPIEGPASGSTPIIVTGDEGIGFDNAVNVTIGGFPVEFTVDSDTQISFATPPHKVESVDISVIANGKVYTCSKCYKYQSIPTEERIALIELYNSTGGLNWKDKTNWLGGEGTECLWKGIKCDVGDNNVIEIDLDYNHLVGTIPSSIGNFSELRSVKVRGNQLTGDFPLTMINLESMEEGKSDFCQNICLRTSDKTLHDLLTKWQGGDWESCQIYYIPEVPIIVDPSILNIYEQSTESVSFSIKLINEPMADITIELLSSNIGECNVDKSSVTLNSSNWESGVSVNVTAEDDGVADGDQVCTILTRHTVSDDISYNGINPEDVTVIVYDASDELTINSVYPAFGLENQNLNVTIQGNGFDSDTYFFLIPQDENGNASGSEIKITPEEVNSRTEVALTLPGQPAGLYGLKVSDSRETDELKTAITFASTDGIFEQSGKKAIILGGIRGDDDILRNAVLTCTKKAYHSLISQGYTSDTIQYLIREEVIDITGDGNNDRDGDADRANLENTIKNWTSEYSEEDNELLIYVTGRGGDAYLTLNDREEVSAKELDEWLDELQQTMKGRIIIIYDACLSGSFIPDLAGNNRIVLTSTSPDESAWFLDNGEFSFSHHFWDSVYYTGRLYWSFVTAKDMMKIDQTSLGDSDGDGIANTVVRAGGIGKIKIDDGEPIDDIQIGRGRIAASEYPNIEISFDDIVLNCEISKTVSIHINTNFLNEISLIMANIILPSQNDEILADPVTFAPAVKLADPDEDGIYEFNFDFKEAGIYKFFVYAVDREGYYSIPESFIITKKYQCDMTGDDLIDSADAIMALRELSASSTADENRGLEKVIHILRMLVGMGENL